MTLPAPEGRGRALAIIAMAAALLSLAPAPGGAVLAAGPPQPPEAVRIQSAIQDALDGVRWPFKRGENVTVTERDGTFHILIPGVTFEIPAKQQGHKSGAIDFGDVRITARPRPDGRYRVRLVLPEKMGVRESGGGTTAILIAKQRFDGIWAPELESFIKIDAAFENIRLQEPGARPLFRIGTVVMKADFLESTPGSWNGPVIATLRDLEFADKTGKGRVHVGSVEMRTDARDMKLAEQSRFLRGMNATLMRFARSREGQAQKKRMTKAEARQLLRIFRTMPRFFADATSETRIADITFSETPGAPPSTIKHLLTRVSLKGLDKARSSFEFRYEHSGFDVGEGAGDGIAWQLSPERMIVDLAAVRLPNDALWRALLDGIEAAAKDPKLGETLFADRVEAALLAAGSELRLNSLRFEAPGFLIKANGRVRADRGAVKRVNGELTMTVRGFDSLVGSLVRSPKELGMAPMAPFVALISAFGEPGTDETGAPIRRYRLTLKRDGKVLLNGKETGGLIGAPGKTRQAPERPKQPPARPK